MCFTNEKGSWFSNSYDDVPRAICFICTMCGGVLSSCRDTQNFFNSPSWEWKVQGCNEQRENSTLEFKYLHVPLSVLWDRRNGNPQAFALQIGFGNWLSLPSLWKCQLLTSDNVLEPCRDWNNQDLLCDCEMHLCIFSATLWDCDTVPGCRLQKSLKLWAGCMLHPKPVQWQGLGTVQLLCVPLSLQSHVSTERIHSLVGAEVCSYRGITWMAVDKHRFSVLKHCTPDNAT